jgi:hypothetical protein
MKVSSKKTRLSNLAAPQIAKMATKLLTGLANLQDGDKPLKWFRRNFPYVLADLSSSIVRMETEDPEESLPYYRPCLDDESKCKYLLLPLRATLRAIWQAPDRRTKEWGMFRVSQDFFHQGNSSLIHSPLDDPWNVLLTQVKPPSQTELLLLEFVKLAEYTRYCGNPDCTSPYFIASKRSQKYCTTDCASCAQREFKLKWWREKGSKQRAAKAKRPK